MMEDCSQGVSGLEELKISEVSKTSLRYGSDTEFLKTMLSG